ncbi:DoxX family protein [Bradyrhizobium prioriisuperbiae]|uniref:DoxX family protein n=1 Tax=Bradyrhizobium prioriisuperbiae TaxID=2854389 RepID=UPI0028E2B55F|nr:DoxX family protein [Bradyrhizobium prioritasuperba]
MTTPTETNRLVFPQLARFYAMATPLAYAVQRVAIGGTLMTHGLPKLTGSAHGSMANPMAGSINLIANKLYLPAAEHLGAFVAYLETFGGVALAVGLLTRIVAPMFAVQMACICLALGQTWPPNWPWIDRGIEYPFLLGLFLLHIAFAGGGRLSADRLVGREI